MSHCDDLGRWWPSDFEPYTGQDYRKGFWRVRFPDGRETWAYPNAGAFHVMSEDGRSFTGETLESGECEARFASDEFHDMLWAQEDEDREEDKRVIQKLVIEPRTFQPSYWGMKPAPCRRAAPKIGRNEPCPCGSGQKHKRCCLRKRENRVG